MTNITSEQEIAENEFEPEEIGTDEGFKSRN